MFDSVYKKPIPALCMKKLGVVTAPTGAADAGYHAHFQTTQSGCTDSSSTRHWCRAKVPQRERGKRHTPCWMQDGVDVIIAGRGGGSIEDLWAFNEEETARAIFSCRTPVISAVGHETDTTIADYVADLRAPTPSAAAELAVYDYWKTQEQVDVRRSQLQGYLRRKMEVSRLRIEKYETKLKYLHPEHKLQEDRQRLADTEEKLHMLLHRKVEQYRHRFAVYMEQMKGLSPLQKLNQGYAYIEDVDKKAVRSIEQVRCGDHLSAYVTDGSIQMIVESVKEERHG